MEDLALRGQHEVRINREMKLRQTLQNVMQFPPSIHGPQHAAASQFRQCIEKLGHDRRLDEVVDESAIEIGA